MTTKYGGGVEGLCAEEEGRGAAVFFSKMEVRMTMTVKEGGETDALYLSLLLSSLFLISALDII